MNKEAKLYIPGHSGMLGSALMRRLKSDGYVNIITRTHSELDLTRQADVEAFFIDEKPEYVFLLAAKTGGIAYNRDYPADMLISNSLIELNVIKAAFGCGVKKLIFTASNTVYPVYSRQPMSEELLLTGSFEEYWDGYALAKSLGIKLCECLGRQFGAEFAAVVLPNLYGPGGNTSTVFPMLIEKFYAAAKKKAGSVDVWGTGNARREFLHVDDAVDAMLFILDKYKGGGHLNVGFGSDISIRELAELIKKISGFEGNIIFDPTKPEGAMEKLLDCSKLSALGWKPKITFEKGAREVYEKHAKSCIIPG